MEQQKKRWYQKWWGILLLIVFFVITVPIAIIQCKLSKKKKIFLWIGYVILLIIGIGVQIAEVETGTTETVTQKKVDDSKQKSNKTEENIKEALKKIGIEKNFEIIRDENLDNMAEENTKGYRVKTDFSQQGIPVYVNADETVHSIRYADKDYYLKGKVLDSIKNDTVTKDEMYDYKYKIEETVKSALKSPATAKFPNISEWSFTKKDGILTVQSYVDSQNSFGALIRGDFKIKYDEKNEKITSFILEGQELIK